MSNEQFIFRTLAYFATIAAVICGGVFWYSTSIESIRSSASGGKCNNGNETATCQLNDL